jgi:hypothetical protein
MLEEGCQAIMNAKHEARARYVAYGGGQQAGMVSVSDFQAARIHTRDNIAPDAGRVRIRPSLQVSVYVRKRFRARIPIQQMKRKTEAGTHVARRISSAVREILSVMA